MGPVSPDLHPLKVGLCSAFHLSAFARYVADESLDIALQREAIALGALGEGRKVSCVAFPKTYSRAIPEFISTEPY